jgi:hypothetical protein
MRLRIALAAAAASLSLGLVAVPVAEASNGTAVAPKVTALPALYTVHHVNGVTKDGKKFSGSYAIQRFIVRGHRVVAYGTLRGFFNGRHVTRYGVKMPAGLNGDTGTGSTPAARAAASCPILHLVLGPINLNLLGLQVTLGGGPQANQPIVLDITAVSGNGNLLGNLLCGLTNALNQGGVLGQLSNDLQQLAASLNALTALLGSL